MGLRYHETTAYRRREREGKESFKAFMGLLALPFVFMYMLFYIIFIFPLKLIFKHKKRR